MTPKATLGAFCLVMAILTLSPTGLRADVASSSDGVHHSEDVWAKQGQQKWTRESGEFEEYRAFLQDRNRQSAQGFAFSIPKAKPRHRQGNEQVLPDRELTPEPMAPQNATIKRLKIAGNAIIDTTITVLKTTVQVVVGVVFIAAYIFIHSYQQTSRSPHSY